MFLTGDEYMARIQDERIRWNQVGDEFEHSAHHSWSGDNKDDAVIMAYKKAQICSVCKLTSTFRKMEIEDGNNSICVWCVKNTGIKNE